MWKFFVRTIVSVFSILILAGIGYFFYEAYMLKYPTCVSHASVITRVTDALNSTQLATEFGFKITRLQNVEESLYDRGRKTRLCVATAVLDNGKTTPVAFKIIGKNDSYHLEAEFTKVVDVVLDEVIKRWEELLVAAEENVNSEANKEMQEENNQAEQANIENNVEGVSEENTVEENTVGENIPEETPAEEPVEVNNTENNPENAVEENNQAEQENIENNNEVVSEENLVEENTVGENMPEVTPAEEPVEVNNTEEHTAEENMPQ